MYCEASKISILSKDGSYLLGERLDRLSIGNKIFINRIFNLRIAKFLVTMRDQKFFEGNLIMKRDFWRIQDKGLKTHANHRHKNPNTTAGKSFFREMSY